MQVLSHLKVLEHGSAPDETVTESSFWLSLSALCLVNQNILDAVAAEVRVAFVFFFFFSLSLFLSHDVWVA